MTFCLGIKVEEGLVGIADTRVTTGSECITARKMTLHQHGRHSMFLTTSGLRAARDKALTYFEEVIEESDTKFDRLYKAVNAFAEQIRRVADEDARSLAEAGLPFNLHTLVGGQLSGDREHKLYMLYPQGNWVEVSRGSPYFVIGESRYGKPLLDRVLRYESSLECSLKAGYLAFDATRASASDVDFPLDVVLYRRDTFDMVEHRYTDEELRPVSQWWQEQIQRAFSETPGDWTQTVMSKLPPLRATEPV